ncbi:hypothetical protein STXM2123_1570 [Streptomyces sp. F-3]|jgi:hypothetical protein|uniref:Uncharacterized protein n=1 Tax=Streptomyces thermogriseus TaxID=75292 RepID=A0ABN1SS22_9ACTN|nr:MULTISPECIES: hypothetical protein [Streptomyces]MDN5382447.1 hypothetical protein [Streptomyces sp. LB8]GAT80869.1 hypothetical protein STXM2123_1570 [Streptomyces sp. F-3]
MSVYGRANSEWDELAEAGRNFLIERARLGKLTSYTELNATLVRRTGCRPFDFQRADERAAMGHLLGLIVERDQEIAPSDPPVMLSALVVYLDSNDAGTGFYQLAKELGLLSMSASAREKFEFWIEQVKRIQARHGAGPAVA